MSYSRSDIKLKFFKDEVEFYVNKKKGVVTCKIKALLDTPFDWKKKVYLDNKDIVGIGIAKCLEGDIFDEERGKRIALAKAENDAYDKASNYLCEYLDEMSKLTMLIFNFIDKAGRHEAHNLDYIESIHNPEHSMYKEIVTKIKSGTTNGKPNCELVDDIKIIPCSANLNL